MSFINLSIPDDVGSHSIGTPLKKVTKIVDIPVIASGGAGELEHLYEATSKGKADAVLAASIFHFGTYTIAEAKTHMLAAGAPVRGPAEREILGTADDWR